MGNTSDYAPVIEAVQEAGDILRQHFGKVQPVRNKGELVVANIGSSNYDYHNHNFLATNTVVYEELTGGASPLFPIKGT